MATTKETMKVIAKGIDEKEEPDVIPAKTIIRVEVPDELADIIERDIDSISICRKKEDMKREEITPEDEYEAADVEELAEQIIIEIAEKAAADFVLFAGEADPECVLLVLEVLRKRYFSSLPHALRSLCNVNRSFACARCQGQAPSLMIEIHLQNSDWCFHIEKRL